jgi:hypothetical protein
MKKIEQLKMFPNEEVERNNSFIEEMMIVGDLTVKKVVG